MRYVAVIILAAAGLMPAITASAQQDEALGRFRDWVAVSYVENGQRICYMVSQPKNSEGDYTVRGPTYLQVTRRGGGGTTDVVSIEAGYPFKRGSEVDILIDGKQHALFTDGETAWAYDEKADKSLVKSMGKGSTLIVKGVSQRGTQTQDTYSLMGFMAAQRAITKACGK